MIKNITLLFTLILSINIIAQNKVAITFDDLPAATVSNDFKVKEKILNNLMDKIIESKVPVIGFVNEEKMYTSNVFDNRYMSLLKNWLNKGFELSNHTFSHKDIHQDPLAEYEQDILKGEEHIKPLAQETGHEFKYFRHPFLHTGRNAEIRDSLSAFLKIHNYRIAPVTVDNSDWIFARAYDSAYSVNNKNIMDSIKVMYVEYLNKYFAYYEHQSDSLFNRNINQILLIHASRLNSDAFSLIANMLKKRNYNFISLDEALKDEVFKSEDKYFGAGGISWIHRWAITIGKRGKFFAGEPNTPQFILNWAGMEKEY